MVMRIMTWLLWCEMGLASYDALAETPPVPIDGHALPVRDGPDIDERSDDAPRLLPRFSLGYSSVLSGYLSLGGHLGIETVGDMWFVQFPGPLVEAHLGLDGWGADVGWGNWGGFAGHDLHLSYRRGWGDRDAWLDLGLARAHHVGIGAHLRALAFRGHLRLLWQLDGPPLDTPRTIPLIELALAFGI